MNFPVQHDELTTLQYLITNYFPAKDAAQAQTVLSRLVTIAAIEAQGVPDGYAGSLYVSGAEHCVTVEFESAAQAQAYQNWLASAPPAPQADGNDAEASVNKTNAVLASRYFELLKVVEQYEKNGVTCQTFRHFVSEPCAECNSPGRCGNQASVVQQEPVAHVNSNGVVHAAGYPWNPSEILRPLVYGDTHPAQQAKPQPLSAEQLKQLLAAEYNRGWNDCEATHDGP